MMIRIALFLLVALLTVPGALAQDYNVPFNPPQTVPETDWYEGTLVSSWPMSSANDEYGSNHWTNTGVSFTSGKVGNAGLFQAGQSDRMSISNANAGDFIVGDNDFTFCAWVWQDTNIGTVSYVLALWDADAGSDNSFAWRYGGTTNGRFLISADGSNNTVGFDPNITQETWTHNCISYDSSDDEWLRAQNGDLTPHTTSHSGGAFSGTSLDFVLGARSGITQFWVGMIDEARWYSDSITDIEADTGVFVPTCEYNADAGRSLAQLSECNP